MRVQEEIARRAKLETNVGKRRQYSAKFALSNTVYCAHCGEVFQRTHWDVHGKKKIVWRCLSRLHKKKAPSNCPARTITELDLHAVVIKAINEVFARQGDFLPKLKANIEKVLVNSNSVAIAAIEEKIEEKQKQLIRMTKSRQNCDTLGDEIIKLREEKHNLLLEDANREGSRAKLDELESFLSEQTTEVQEFNDALVRRLIENITVYDDHFKVKFKSGIEIDV